MKKGFRFLRDLVVHFSKDLSAYFHKSWQAGLVTSYVSSCVRSLIYYLNQFRIYLHINGIQNHHIKEEKILRLQSTSQGLHSLLPQDDRFSYSIVIAVTQARPALFEDCLQSALNQSAPHMEVLVGLMDSPSKEIEDILQKEKEKSGERLQIHQFFHIQNKSEMINALAEKSQGHFLFELGEEDWIRPDLLFRFEQTLRIYSNPETRVLYCNLNGINDKGYFLPNSEHCQPQLSFPFFFKLWMKKGMLIPKLLWQKSSGLNPLRKGVEYEGLLLQLDLLGASFHNIPLALYSVRASTSKEELPSEKLFLEVLEDYSRKRNLNWTWSSGYLFNQARAIPLIPSLSIQVVIPYKDQKTLTMQCIKSLLNQEDVQLQITAVDNQSKDPSIAAEIEALGGEVISIREPFNYSRLNNLAVKQTKKGKDCPIILFLNNDVELGSDALSEMVRWIDQPQVGMVGCRLHYPDGRLQHGGVRINPYGREEVRWEHVEKLRRFDEMKVTKELGFFDAVTAACAMIKRETFLEVGGFDEIWHPIGYSDTDLAMRLAAKGLKCFYTPYAVGIHHESISRKSSIEDFENSWWLHNKLLSKLASAHKIDDF